MIAGSLPYNCYPASVQQLYLDMFARGAAQLSDIEGVVISESAPTASDRDKLWIKLVGGVAVSPFVWSTLYARWIWPHSSSAGGFERRLWVGTEAALATYDGGDGNPLGPASGPMWQVDHDFDGRSPMGPGAIPDTVDSLGVGGDYGQGQHPITTEEMPSHSHDVDAKVTTFSADGGGTIYLAPNPDPATYVPFLWSTKTKGGDIPINWVHPVRGCFLIGRTARQFLLGA